MYSSKVVSSDHRDLIHDVAFNWYGTHLATCSSDQDVKIWTWDTERNSWACSARWRSHAGAVWKVTWAHPEFGQVLATCSFDRTACIWEEVAGEDPSADAEKKRRMKKQQQQKQQQEQNGHGGDQQQQQQQQQPAGGDNDVDLSKTHWIKRASLVDSRTSVSDVKFAPKHLGLMLATCSTDGMIRIYEAPDVMSLAQWSLMYEIKNELSCSCISWNPTVNKSQAPMIAVGSDDPSASSGPKVCVYELVETARRWQRVEALFGGVGGGTTDAVHDIAFAPNVGRSYALLAVAASGDLRIVTLKSLYGADDPREGQKRYEVKLAGRFVDHASTVWRVCWNVTGTVLASSGDDGRVRLWKANYMDNWRCVASLRSDGKSQQQQPPPMGNAFNAAGGFAGMQQQHQLPVQKWH